MRRLALLVACALALLACGGAQPAARPPAHDGVRELAGIGQLRAAFNAHPGVPRLIVLASPT